MTERTILPLSRMRRRTDARADLGPPEAAMALFASRLECQIHDLLVMPPDSQGIHDILDGNRTHWGGELLGRLDAELRVVITDEPLDDPELLRRQLLSAIHRADISPYDKACAMRDMKAARGLTNKALADELGLDASTPTPILSLFGTIPAVQEAARENRVGVADWYRLSKLSPDEQRAELDRILGRKKGRQQPEKSARKARLVCPLPSGVVVQVTGEAVTMGDALESIKEAQKAIQAAMAKHLSEETAMAYWADIARA